ncbi:MAG: SRPBCC domain-containing protein, partial [Aggregatilineales bacterium]
MSTTITQEIMLNMSAGDAYRLISDPAHISRWFSDRVETHNENKLYFEWDGENGTNGFEAQIIEATPGKVFSYRSIEDSPSTTTFTLSSVDNGTKIIMVESDVTENYEEHVGGWQWF